jgi:hypothetical protein
MELDDLKNAWKQDAGKQTNTPDIMELIHQKSKGPIASLKTAFRKQMAAVAVLMSTVVFSFARNVESLGSHLLFWTCMGFCVALIAALFANYRLSQKMESMNEKVKDNLEQHVALLEQRLKWQNIGARVVILVFILLLEVIPLFQHIRMVSTWHALSPFIRFSVYAAYLVFQYFLSRFVQQRKFGKHLDHLKSLLQEMR